MEPFLTVGLVPRNHESEPFLTVGLMPRVCRDARLLEMRDSSCNFGWIDKSVDRELNVSPTGH